MQADTIWISGGGEDGMDDAAYRAVEKRKKGDVSLKAYARGVSAAASRRDDNLVMMGGDGDRGGAGTISTSRYATQRNATQLCWKLGQ